MSVFHKRMFFEDLFVISCCRTYSNLHLFMFGTHVSPQSVDVAEDDYNTNLSEMLRLVYIVVAIHHLVIGLIAMT